MEDRFVDVSLGEFAQRVRALAGGLIRLGVRPGERVALMSSTRLEWTLLDYAIWAAGAVTVPVYETSSAEQLGWILADSDAVLAIVEDADLKSVYEQATAQTGRAPEHPLLVIDDGALDELADQAADQGTEDQGPEEVRARADAVTGDDLATIVYTSGTTGRPKGCVLTHGNLLWEDQQLRSALEEVLTEDDTTLLFLPLAHIFARIIQVGCLNSRVKLGFASHLEHLPEELAMFRPSFLLGVPRMFEKMFNRAAGSARAAGRGWLFDYAVAVSVRRSRQRQSGRVSATTRLAHLVFDRLVFARLREAVGGRVRFAGSGGAALAQRLGHFFDGAGIPVLEGYGLTETSGGATCNRPGSYRIGTVGQPVPGCSVRIADDGEVLIKGRNVFQGYWRNEEATRQVLDPDGWLRSGDLGELDEDGFLRIIGRKKNILVTAGGKNVAPLELEHRLRSHPLVSHAIVLGDGRPFVSALVTIDREELPRWARQHGRTGKRLSELTDDAELRAEIEQAVEHANRSVSRAASVRKFAILPEELSVEGGELTPTMKVRRQAVKEKYAEVIADLYGDA